MRSIPHLNLKIKVVGLRVKAKMPGLLMG